MNYNFCNDSVRNVITFSKTVMQWPNFPKWPITFWKKGIVMKWITISRKKWVMQCIPKNCNVSCPDADWKYVTLPVLSCSSPPLRSNSSFSLAERVALCVCSWTWGGKIIENYFPMTRWKTKTPFVMLICHSRSIRRLCLMSVPTYRKVFVPLLFGPLSRVI